MSQDSDSKFKPPQGKDGKSSHSLATTPTLKLVVSNPAPAPVQTTSDASKSNARFSVKVSKVENNLYKMSIQDPFHDLGCDLTLESKRGANETTVTCHVPVFLDDSNKFLDEDEILYGIIVVQFQMNVLEQLFMFCTKRNASRLTIYMDNAQAEGFGIYQDFLVHCNQAITKNGKQREMVISTGRKPLSKWRSFMKKNNLELEQGLWREQRFNYAIRRYLKSRAHG